MKKQIGRSRRLSAMHYATFFARFNYSQLVQRLFLVANSILLQFTGFNANNKSKNLAINTPGKGVFEFAKMMIPTWYLGEKAISELKPATLPPW